MSRLPKAPSVGEATLARDLRALKITGWVPQHEFAPPRKWAFDFAWPTRKIAVEIEGLFKQGGARHQTMDGYEKDCEKYNEAALLGWVVLRFSPAMVRSGAAYPVIERALAYRPEPAMPTLKEEVPDAD